MLNKPNAKKLKASNAVFQGLAIFHLALPG
jgi:hypothetical protein